MQNLPFFREGFSFLAEKLFSHMLEKIMPKTPAGICAETVAFLIFAEN